MPELPDVTVYQEAVAARVVGQALERIRLASPFLLRSVTPPLSAAEGRVVQEVRRLGKRLVLALEGEHFLVLHLMIAGRLHWKDRGAALVRKRGMAAFDFPHGSLVLTEAGAKKRASLYLVQGAAALAEHAPGGQSVFDLDPATFQDLLQRERHTLKRSLTDPGLFDGIGNAYSDEILHRARLSPVTLTDRLSAEECTRLHAACQEVLREWTGRLRQQAGDAFPAKVTAFRPEMVVHGKFGQPCPDCATPVQRIVYADRETNYCPACQTGGRLLKDRALSQLLRQDWPRSVEEWEARRRPPA